MTEPTFDVDDYPTDETLHAIQTLDDATAALDLARASWHWPDFVSDELRESERDVLHDDWLAERAGEHHRYVRFATGGWSGNESIISALNRNPGARLCWQLSACGGLHIYRYPRCPVFRPDHNGECLTCDEWIDAHSPEAIAAGERLAAGAPTP